MKKNWIMAAALLSLILWAAPALAEENAAWTVMFYLCGSDLESNYGYASENLKEIANCYTYKAVRQAMGNEPVDAGRVNVVVETGGCKQWHAGELGMEIRTDALQRWHFEPAETISSEEHTPFVLDEELPLACMADPETLADFIRWGAEACPAEKYALVLWDHGGGSKTGLFIDELFDDATLYMDELGDALRGGGVTFEAVLFDACLMANLETACAIRDSARWMIASEEVVAGKGTAVGDWLQQLYYTPQWDGRRLGRWICETTRTKYAEEADEQVLATMTWSVIDLSKIGRVAEMFDQFFAAYGQCYASDPALMTQYAHFLRNGTEFGLGDNDMHDLSEIFHVPMIAGILDPDLYAGMVDALMDAVAHNIHGPGRSRAGGLSFCYAAESSPEELSVYARNCPSASYLAFLDAITFGWSAPDWVYETAERLPDIQELADYQIQAEKRVTEDGTPGFTIVSGMENVGQPHGRLYRLNEKNNRVELLGATAAFPVVRDGTTVFSLDTAWRWCAVEDVHCCAELVSMEYLGRALYNIPVRVGTENGLLRCCYDESSDELLTIYGLWQGYDADNHVFNRNVVPLAQLAGQEFSLLFPVDGTGDSDKTLYEASGPMTMYRSLEMTAKPLPPGTYYLEYWVEDIFLRHLPIGRAEIVWDGETPRLADPAAWEGVMTLTDTAN